MLEMETFIRRKVTHKTGVDAWLKTTYKSAVAANAKKEGRWNSENLVVDCAILIKGHHHEICPKRIHVVGVFFFNFFSLKDETRFYCCRIFNFSYYTFQNRSSLCAAHSQTSLRLFPSWGGELDTFKVALKKKNHMHTQIFWVQFLALFFFFKGATVDFLLSLYFFSLLFSSFFCTHECCKCSRARAYEAASPPAAVSTSSTFSFLPLASPPPPLSPSSPPSACMSEVQRVRLSRNNCIMRVESL